MKTPRKIEDEMSRYPTIISGATCVRDALEMMERFQIRHLPVLNGKQVIGVVSDRDLKKAEVLGGAMTLVAPEYMTADPYCVPEGTPLAQVARVMAREKYGCAVVIDDHGKVSGIFTTVDALETLAKVLERSPPDREEKAWRIRDVLPGNYLFGT